MADDKDPGFIRGLGLTLGAGLVVIVLATAAVATMLDDDPSGGSEAAATTVAASTAEAATTAEEAAATTGAEEEPAEGTPAAESDTSDGDGGSGEGSGEIALAPAFTADELAELPGANWITNGGSLANQRYSPLDAIDVDNVADLKGVWMTDLGGSGVAAKYSGEAQPIAYDGTLYVPTGADDVFAVDVASGDIRWKYEAKLDQKISTVCCGWTSRGVAIGDGRVYLGQLDGQLVALDQATGEVAWSTPVAKWQDGYTITNAPLYFDGRVYTGLSGGEFGARGRVTAFDAKTGKELWRFNTIPGPGEVGHDTWPAGNDSWKRGGAPVWQTPSVDPELGLLYFSTGNASPDLNGFSRAGDNLFSASIVAIDAETGEYRWHFQQVHHDIWDYDAPSPTVLFDVEIDGTMRKGIAEASKTGWLYMLDRTNGKPLYGIEERPVPQSALQKTSKTQPYPSNPPFSSHDPGPGGQKAIADLAKAAAKGGKAPKVTVGPIFTPFDTTIVALTPGPQGGTNWPASSYNPDTQLVYVCSQSAVSGYSSQKAPEGHKPGQAYIGSVFTTTGFGTSPGRLTAIDARSGDIAWQKKWPDSCYSGSITTGGNLVFVGRNNGELEAYNATDGTRVWNFQTGAGANATATVFDKDGTEYVAFYAAGNALAGSAHGDNLWLFSLDGTMGPAPVAGADEAVTHAGGDEPGTKSGDAALGKVVFSDNCSGCHGLNGTGGNGGPDLTSIPDAKDTTKVIEQVQNGGGGMPPFKGVLTDKQIRDVAAYVVTITGK